jgi:bla regulator protein blaR1
MIPSQFQPLANHLWQSTVFACGVWLVTLALTKNRAAVRHRLWVAASLKFLVPFAVLVSLGSQVEWRTAPTAVSSRMLAVERLSDPFADLAPPQPLDFAPRKSSWLPAILSGVWLCGFAANMTAWFRRWRHVRAAVRAAAPIAVGWPIRAVSSPAQLEPGVFGAFRPLLLLPDGIEERLTPAQFDAVVQHELCHVRRWDNLIAAIHMLVEALFWFHPLVWWIQARLVEERERACDEEVLRLGSDPRDYAEAIVNVAKFYLESPLVCVAGVTGANLKQRVEAIMLNRGVQRLGVAGTLLVASAGLAAVGVPVALGIVNAPPLGARAESFGMASIRRILPVDGMIRATPQTMAGATPLGPTKLGAILGAFSGTQFAMPIGTVKSLIMDAYNTTDKQIEGLPKWAAGTEFYSINAWIEGDLTPTPDQLRLMLQTLLAEQFHLRGHRETREVPVYELTVGEGASKVKAAPDDASDAEPWFAIRAIIRQRADRPVVDKTGFGARVYAPGLDWRDWLDGQAVGRLGLTLKPVIQPTDFIVVENIERPKED